MSGNQTGMILEVQIKEAGYVHTETLKGKK